MNFFSYHLRDLKVRLAFRAAYRTARQNQTGLSQDSRLRVLMHGGSLGERDGQPFFTGIGRYVLELVHAMIASGDDVDICLLTEGRYPDIEPAARYRNIRCTRRTAFAVELGREIACGGHTLLHLTDSDSYSSHLLPALTAAISVITVQDVMPVVLDGYAPKWRRAAYVRTLKTACERCTVLLVASQFTLQDLKKITGLPCEQAVITPLGVDKKFSRVIDDVKLAAVRRKYGLPDRFVLTVGRTAPHKNVPRLVEAVSRMRASGTIADLVIVGGRDDLGGAEAVDRAIVEHNGTAWVYWPGHIDDSDLPALYSLCAAFAFPSLYEGFGLPVLEAMACGAPVVCSNAASLPEVAGNAALLVDASSPQEMASAIARVCNDAALREQLERSGYVRAAEFTWQRTATLTLSAYRRAILDLHTPLQR